MKKRAVLLNPSSGSQRAEKNIERLKRLLKKHNIEHDLYISKNEKHLITLTQKLAKEYKTIICAGGDSTLLIMLNTIIQKKLSPILGFIGLGSSDDIVRDFGHISLEKAVEAIAKNKTTPIDIGYIKEKNKIISYFPGQANIGLGVSVNRYVETLKKNKKFFGRLQALAGLTGIILAYKRKEIPLKLEIKTNNKILSAEYTIALFTKIKYWASGLLIAPSAKLSDGKLQVVLFKNCSFFRLLRLALLAAKGKHIDEKEIQIISGDSFTIKSDRSFSVQVDGEILKTGKKEKQFNTITIGVLRKKIKVLK
ncbi:MAG: diacylglycerol kinase family protein [Spirochaetia bacterium]|nr:diacylglycerol kinase family protein [Spirochaetia bacterium]